MLQPGDNLGRYVLLEHLATGGMGEVYIAAQKGPMGIGPKVALKVLRSELASDPEFVEMLVDEANISMFLNHQNVVSVLDLAETSGTFFLAMEFVQGVNVQHLVDRMVAAAAPMDAPLALFIVAEVAKGLKYAHSRVDHEGRPLNIIHRDVTPANVLCSVHGEVKLTDFGIARARNRLHRTQAGLLKGKFGYMAPEAVRGQPLDQRADLFCLGVTLYLLLTGRHPASDLLVAEAIERFERGEVLAPSSVNPALPRSLDPLVLRALEPNPRHRWPSAEAMLNALQQALLSRPDWRGTPGGVRLVSALETYAPEAFRERVPSSTAGRPPQDTDPGRQPDFDREPSLPEVEAEELEDELDDATIVEPTRFECPEEESEEPSLSPVPLQSEASHPASAGLPPPPTSVWGAPERRRSTQSLPPRKLRAVPDSGVRVAPVPGGSLGWDGPVDGRGFTRSESSDPRASETHQGSVSEREPRTASADLPPEDDWSDDATARRLLATRTPAPSLQTPVSRPSSRARIGVAPWIATAVVLLAASGAYVTFFTSVFWPRIDVQSSPSGAVIFLDGVQVGLTPASIRVAPDTAHQIVLEKNGFRRAVRRLVGKVTRGGVYDLSVDLEPVSTLHLAPAAVVRVNGVEVGRGERVELPSFEEGRPVEIRADAPGFQTYLKRFEDPTEVPDSWDVTLEPLR